MKKNQLSSQPIKRDGSPLQVRQDEIGRPLADLNGSAALQQEERSQDAPQPALLFKPPRPGPRETASGARRPRASSAGTLRAIRSPHSCSFHALRNFIAFKPKIGYECTCQQSETALGRGSCH
jgi:hypothetical protein